MPSINDHERPEATEIASDKYSAKYKPEYVEMARKACAIFGATTMELAELFNVSGRAIKDWMLKYEDFRLACKVGKEIADSKVEDRLYQRALGYDVTEVKTFCHEGKIITHEITKHYPPDTVACIFWLKNRQPQEWRDVHKVEKTVKHVKVGNNEELRAKLDRALANRSKPQVQ